MKKIWPHWIFAYFFALITLNQFAYALSSEDIASTAITTLQVEREGGAIYLNSQLKFDLPPAVEDVLLKGIPLIFVLDAEIRRERWYWYDKKLTVVARQMRLTYQPLTRRWRLNVTSGMSSANNSGSLGGGLPQYFDTLAEAMSNLQRIRRWRILDVSEIDQDAPHTLELTFKLDVSQLPRPFQIGLIGQSDWNISATKNIRFSNESIK